jgi:cytochrome P450
MAVNEHRFARHAEVVAALADPALVPVEPLEEAGVDRHAVGSAAWLRAHVARFAHGPAHVRRRAVVEDELARLDEDGLRRAAAQCARKAGDGADPRVVAVRALAGELGLPDPDAVAADVALVSGVYFGGSDPAADEAVARLVAAYRAGAGEADGDGEALANRISILVQAFEATGSLVERARGAASEYGLADSDGTDHAGGVAGLVYETLRHDPPVLAMRRIALRPTSVAGVEIAAGDLVTLDIAAANRDPEVFDRPDEFDAGRGETPLLTYGSAPRRCPGVGHSLALATAILKEGGR